VKHLEELIKTIKIPVSDISRFVSPEREKIIRVAFAKIGDTQRLSPVKEILGDDFAYEEIGLVRAVLEAASGRNAEPQ